MLRILIDTNVIRWAMHGELQLSLLTSIPKSQKLRFTIPPYFLAELIQQLQQDESLFEQWLTVRPDVSRLIDPTWPMIPDGEVLCMLMGLVKNPHRHKPENVRRELVRQWRAFLSINTWDEMKATEVLKGYVADISNSKEQWGTAFDSMKELASREADMFKEIVEHKEEFLKARVNRPRKDDEGRVTTTAFHLAYDRLVFHYFIRSTESKGPYNPTSPKSINDAIDFKAVVFLTLPVILMTADEKFRKRVVAAKLPEVNQILLPTEFAQESYDTLWAKVSANAERVRVHLQKVGLWLDELIEVM